MKRTRNFITSLLGLLMLTMLSFDLSATKWTQVDGPGVIVGDQIFYLYRCERKFLSTDGCEEGEYRWESESIYANQK